MARPRLTNIGLGTADVVVDGAVVLTIRNARDVIYTASSHLFTDADGAQWQFSRATGDFEAVAAEEG